MKRTICQVHGTFNGLYGWGRGWNMDAKDKWNEFLTTKLQKHGFWRLLPAADDYSSDQLVTMGCVVYLHPLCFNATLVDCGVTSNGKYFTHELKELYKICSELAEYCGGSFEMSVSDEIEINIDGMSKYAETA